MKSIFNMNTILQIEFIQPDGEQPSTSNQENDDENENPDDLSEPLSSTGTDQPGIQDQTTFQLIFSSRIFH